MPFKLSDYPKNWKEIATATKTDFGWRCALCRAVLNRARQLEMFGDSVHFHNLS